ncbi:ATP-binding sensor histidine kinase [Vitiosangium sp. GDMCC 1.1324]|uniref:ATP-binding sensor histidine kinase n=1 Tax=Vitiosangium sp. (strain GDMCC 1.1324) TaxID=2138576 RepID=UPI000D333365|nr:ATP-binding sensor histidine kinase [Vitiosangium sp. GDMCC 1.1324]PTL81382.1 protein kinase [Vitiosangium sp. GDMCC 1.1324]
MSLQIPGYRDFLQIHQGRQYVVFRAREERTGEARILKRVQPGPTAAHATAALRHEHEMLGGLDIPGVVRPLGLEEVAGILTLVLEDAGPLDLEQHLWQQPLETGLFLTLAIQIAGLVRSLHRRNVIHRDLNPSNLVVRPDTWQVTLIDFGTATRATGLVGESEGTLAYIAPEQTGRMNRLVDHRADLYALGATFYEMLTGVPPFVSADPVELIHAHLARPPVPPEQLKPSIPQVLSDIVLKLLAKMPEERYQSAEALELDLREAQRQWQASGTIAPFTLAWHDLAQELVLPDKLYGREHELAWLCGALKRVTAGPSEVVLVTGDAGSGKSSLVHDMQGRCEGRARFLFGKFDQLHGNLPHASLVEALRGLVRGLLQEPPAAVLSWRQRLQDALGSSASAMTRFIPELVQLLGEQPASAPLGISETEGRFQLSLQALIQVFATHESPLVLFMDDLQWADGGSLTVLRNLATASDLRHVLLVGAYRSKEVGPEHRLTQVLGAMRTAGVALRTLEVPPLNLGALTRLCSDTLHRKPRQVEPLAKLLLRKTAGNPFFVQRLLRFLHQSGLLTFDAEQREWRWDLERIEQVEVTENVIELMLRAVRRLPVLTQQLLQVASCFRDRVDLWLLAAVAGKSVEETAEALWSAIQEGLLVPASQGSCFAYGTSRGSGSPEARAATYCFVHDRIQQAVYSLLSDEEKRHLHRQVGRGLVGGVSEHELEERLFEVVDYFDMSMESSRDLEPSERLQLAGLYLRAGSKAEATSAFGSALVYLRHGLECLPREAWASHHALALQLHRQAAECAHLTSDHALAEELVRAALPHVTSDLEKLNLYEIHVIAYSICRGYLEAIRWGREGLRLMGQEPPSERELERAFADEAALVNEKLRGRTREELLGVPSAQDPRFLTLMRFMSSVVMAAWFSNQHLLFAFFQARMIHLSLERGHSPYSAHAYVSYAMVLGSMGDYDMGMKLGEAGVELSRRYADRKQECRCLLIFAAGVSHWRVPFRTNLPLLRRAVAAGMEGNEFLFASYAAAYLAILLFSTGTELPLVHAEAEENLVFVQKVGHRDMVGLLLAYRQAVRCLQDRTHQKARYEDDGFSEKEYADSIRESPSILCEYQALRAQTSYLLGDLADALEMSRAASKNYPLMQPALPGIDYVFYTALTLAACYPGAASSEKDSLLSQLQEHLHRLDTWAQGCPENFRHKHQLVSAELARIEGNQGEAMRLYDLAIDSAHQNENPRDEALAQELAGRYYHSLGHRRIASLYLHSAMKGFARWGATAKVAALEEEFPDLALDEALPWKTPTTREHAESRGARLDLLSILKAAETLSGEVVLDRLLEKLMTVCLEVAGAQRGALLLHEDGSLFVRAIGSTSAVSLERTVFHSSRHVPPTMVAQAYDSGSAVILADARRSPFSSDSYVVSHALKSAVAVPIRRQASSVGVLYLENNLATRAFAPGRIRVLQLLSSQMAISLENSLLFEKLHVEVEERRRAERAVRFLAESSVVLAESLDYETTLARIARLAVPFLADCCMVLVQEEPQTLHCVAIACASTAKEALLRDIQRRNPPQWDSQLPGVVAVRTGAPQFIPEVTEDYLQAFSQETGYAELMRAFGTRCGVAVPLIAQDKSIGSISLFRVTPECGYGPADLALAQEMARRAAISIDNARLYREAREAVRLRDEFLSIASHELYTPLTSLKLSMQGLERGNASISPEALSRISQNARLQIRRLTRLIDELLSVSRLQAGQVHLEFEEVDLVAITRGVAEDFREESARSRSPLLIRADAPVFGRWDKTRLEQVITNLLANAIKFGNRKPVEISVDSNEGTALLTVKDHGIGIAPDRLPHIFERFERAVSVREYGGLGLGLYIAHEIVSALGGSVQVESTPGEGTCFTLQLPRAGPPASGVGDPQAAGHA